MNQRFSIRPCIKEGESLTSWLLRLCFLNKINIKDLFGFITNNYVSNDLRNFHQIDLNPDRIININLIGDLTNKNVKSLKNLTLYVVLNKFHNNNDLFFIDKSKTFLKDIFITSSRKFCRDCLNKNIYYKLNWQLSDSVTCEIHNTPLTSECTSCGKSQQYIHENLVLARCQYCNESLIRGNNYNDQLTIPTSLTPNWNYAQWSYLLDPHTYFQINWIEKCKKRSLIILFLYLCCGMNNDFNFNDISYLSRDYKYKLINHLRKKELHVGSFELNLKLIMKILNNSNLNFNELVSIEVPKSYIDSLYKYLFPEEFKKCLAPWCSSFQSSSDLAKLNRTRSKTHGTLYFCLNCNIKYGINKNTQEWEEYGDFINLGWKYVLPLIHQNYSKLSISKILGISRFKVTKVTAFFAINNLISKMLIAKYIPKNKLPCPAINYFETCSEKNEKDIIQYVMNKFFWNISEAYFYYFDNEVQNRLNLMK